MSSRTVTRRVRGIPTSDGAGVKLTRVIGQPKLDSLDPFLLLDEFGSDAATDYIAGFPDHPHRGFETVTYMIDGKFAHQDSHGGGGLITDGATQWMTAGSGILHIETPPAELVESGGVFHGVQLWVNLPKKDKFAPPRYQAIEGADATLLASDDGGALVRIIAGEIDGHRGPGITHTPITLAHATIESGARLNIPWRRDFNALVYVLSGSGYVGPVAHPIRSRQLVVLGPGDRIAVGADQRQAMDVLVLGGWPIREPVFHYGPFVMNTRAELVEALEDYQAGKFGSIPPNALMPHRGGGTI